MKEFNGVEYELVQAEDPGDCHGCAFFCDDRDCEIEVKALGCCGDKIYKRVKQDGESMNILELESEMVKAREKIVVKDLESKLNPKIKPINEHEWSDEMVKKVSIADDGIIQIDTRLPGEFTEVFIEGNFPETSKICPRSRIRISGLSDICGRISTMHRFVFPLSEMPTR